MRDFFGAIDRILFVPFALHDHDLYLQKTVEKRLEAGYTLDGLHGHADAHAAVQEARAIYVGGGNTFRLLAELYRRDLLDLVCARVRAGLPYLGVSAGRNCSTAATPSRTKTGSSSRVGSSSSRTTTAPPQHVRNRPEDSLQAHHLARYH